MPFRLALAVFALLAICAKSASAQILYYCDPLRLYYDPARFSPTMMPPCPVQWRAVNPTISVAPPAPIAQPPLPANLEHGTQTLQQPPTQKGEAEQTDAYRQGGADRRDLQAWFDSQTGDRRVGADYWAANRSVAGHASCTAAATGSKSEFIAGCEEAKRRLEPIDSRRHSDPQYRVGFSDEAKRLPLPAKPTVQVATESSERSRAQDHPLWSVGIHRDKGPPPAETREDDQTFMTRLIEACRTSDNLCAEFQESGKPPCLQYQGFAFVYYQTAGQHYAGENHARNMTYEFAEQTRVKMSEYKPEFLEALKPLLDIAYHARKWPSAEAFASDVYNLCMAGHMYTVRDASAAQAHQNNAGGPSRTMADEIFELGQMHVHDALVNLSKLDLNDDGHNLNMVMYGASEMERGAANRFCSRHSDTECVMHRRHSSECEKGVNETALSLHEIAMYKRNGFSAYMIPRVVASNKTSTAKILLETPADARPDFIMTLFQRCLEGAAQ